MEKKNLLFVLVVAILMMVLFGFGETRPLQGDREEWPNNKKDVVILQSLQRGPVKPSAPNPCSTVGGGKGHCINGMNFAGKTTYHHPPPPRAAVDLALANI
ncbi:hypothetical protein L6164_034450 [Bauhinia variegata]|uniref:Uncharacterized protein n=1 Tax=Bauhinia variegata TaxID=167791 RepID=A0ACB9KUX9_BAUVA|nr:hypothetical protein L6164_034450 [Bauhinia variegata]